MITFKLQFESFKLFKPLIKLEYCTRVGRITMPEIMLREHNARRIHASLVGVLIFHFGKNSCYH